MKSQFLRNRQNGMIFGVCSGLSDQFGISELWTRIGFVGLTLLGFGLPLLLYILIALLAPAR
jgi:phage shock protein C